MMLTGDLATLFTSDLPEGRQQLLDSYSNLDRVAEYCENNYFNADNKRAALEETKGYTTQSLASVAYQINTLAYNFLQMLDLQAAQLGEMESQVNHISQTVDIHREKVARREIGILTTNKASNRQYKIIAPANPERPAKYVRKPIDYSVLDDIGHGVKLAPPPPTVVPGPMSSQQATPRQKRPSLTGSQYGPGMMGSSQYAPGVMSAAASGSPYGSLGNVSANSGPAGPAPTTKPPTPPQANRNYGGTLTRGSKEYRTPPVVAPPQVPSNYAPNYPMQQQQQQARLKQQQYGTLPHPQVQMVHPVQQQQQHSQQMDSRTMPRLSSSSMRSTGSSQSSGGGGSDQMYARHMQQQGGTLGGHGMPQLGSQYAPGGMGRPSIGRHNSTTSSQYAPGALATQSLNRPTQRPPSPPLPPPPVASTAASMMQQQQMGAANPIYSTRMHSEATGAPAAAVYSRQASATSTLADPGSAIYSRQSSAGSLQQQHQLQQELLARQLSRQSSIGGGGGGGNLRNADVPSWVPKNFIEKVTAIYDYNADKEDELSFTEGAIIYVLKKNDDDWWEGVMDGITGLFPGNYVEKIA